MPPSVLDVLGMLGSPPGKRRGGDALRRRFRGGVDFGVPKDDTNHVLSEGAPLLLGHSTGQIEILAHLGTIVVDARTPLRDSILASPLVDTRMHRLKNRGFYDGHWTANHYAKISQGR